MIKTILIVDDEPDVVTTLAYALEAAGYGVRRAFDGLQALESIAKEKPDAILLDLMMPNMDGHSVNIRLKSDPSTASIPVMVMTARAQLKELIEVRKDLQVAAYLEKPFRVKDLIAKLSEIVPAGGAAPSA
ncbi:MAG: response regulator [bacterium]